MAYLFIRVAPVALIILILWYTLKLRVKVIGAARHLWVEGNGDVQHGANEIEVRISRLFGIWGKKFTAFKKDTEFMWTDHGGEQVSSKMNARLSKAWSSRETLSEITYKSDSNPFKKIVVTED